MKYLADIFHPRDSEDPINPFMKAFRTLDEQEKLAKADCLARGEAYEPNIRMYIAEVKAGQNPDRYNYPVGGEIAVCFVSHESEAPSDYRVCIYPRSTRQCYTYDNKAMSQFMDAMTFPLFFPFGDPGNYFSYYSVFIGLY